MLQTFQPRLLVSSLLSLTRSAATTPAKAKGGSRDKGPRRTGELSKTHATGCALLKGESDPSLKPDSEYPAWLWALAEQQPTSKDLTIKYQGQGLPVAQLQRLWRLKNKERIKEDNFLKAKK